MIVKGKTVVSPETYVEALHALKKGPKTLRSMFKRYADGVLPEVQRRQFCVLSAKRLILHLLLNSVRFFMVGVVLIGLVDLLFIPKHADLIQLMEDNILLSLAITLGSVFVGGGAVGGAIGILLIIITWAGSYLTRN